MDFLKIPYLPQKKTIVAVGDIDIPHIKVIKPYYAEILPESMRLHADLSFCYLGKGVAVCAPEAYDYYVNKLGGFSLKLKKGSSPLGRNHPFDAAYNVAIVGNKMFCRVNITDKVLLETAEQMGYKIVNMNQGYGKCSVCPVDEYSAISADMSFFKAAKKEGIDTLVITNHGIQLSGYDNGFFGGCAYMESKNVFSAKGDIRYLPCYDKITDFLTQRNIAVKISHGPVTDFGSFIPIIEE